MSKERPSNAVLEQYYKEMKEVEKRIELDADAKERDREIKKKTQQSIGRKLNRMASLQKGKNPAYPPIREERKRLADKYMNNGIVEILQAERKTSNLLTVAKDDVERFLDDEVRKYIKSLKKTNANFRILSDEEQERRAGNYLASVLQYGSCTSEAEKAMKKKYDELRDEVARCNNEAIAVQMAKDTFLEDNADLIEEARREKRLRELKKSGILEELDLVEKQEKNEEDNEE